jgi:hypothetical protein
MVMSRHSPSGVTAGVKIAWIDGLDKCFPPCGSSGAGRAAGTGWIRMRSYLGLARRRCFSAQRMDLSCRFRSVWAWIAVMRIAVALEGGGSR